MNKKFVFSFYGITFKLVMLAIINYCNVAHAQNLKLICLPDSVYKNDDFSKRNTESWYFRLVVSDTSFHGEILPVEATAKIFSKGVLLETQVFSKALLATMQKKSYVVNTETDIAHPVRLYHRDELFDLGFDFAQKPKSWNADHVSVELKLLLNKKKKISLTYEVPVKIYKQKTELYFPFKGSGIVTQGQINNGGHSGHSNQFALDFIALTEYYAPMVSFADSNSAFSTFGKELIAPADGEVIYARNDVPDNPPGSDPFEIYSKLNDPILANMGNAVFIDHGTGEYSLLCHLQYGSVKVKTGQKIKRGESIGNIGASGDAYQPHLHYQLQSGPELFKDVSVPVKFMDVRGALVRGNYFGVR